MGLERWLVLGLHLVLAVEPRGYAMEIRFCAGGLVSVSQVTMLWIPGPAGIEVNDRKTANGKKMPKDCKFCEAKEHIPQHSWTPALCVKYKDQIFLSKIIDDG